MSRHRHHQRPHGPPWRISPRLRQSTIWVSVSLWVSGGVWMLLHYFWQQPGEFGVTPHPLQPTLMRLHGVLAVAGVFLLGWLCARHIIEAWRQRGLRYSGIALLTISILLVASGYALYYLSDGTLHSVAGIAHQVIGVSGCVFALVHWRRPSSTRANIGNSSHHSSH